MSATRFTVRGETFWVRDGAVIARVESYSRDGWCGAVATNNSQLRR